jgi:hypothetical protein
MIGALPRAPNMIQGLRHFPKPRTPAIPGLNRKHAAPCLRPFLHMTGCLAIATDYAYVAGRSLRDTAI